MEETLQSNLDFSKVSSSNLVTPDKNVPRRKSSIFNRRNTFADDEKKECSGSSSERLGRPTSESDLNFNVDTYMTCLKKEVADWERMYKERKKDRTLAKKHYRSKNVLKDEDVFAILSEEDKKFLEGRKDYNGIGREAVVAMEKLSISLQKTIDVDKSSQLLINYAQKTDLELRKKIIEFSILE